MGNIQLRVTNSPEVLEALKLITKHYHRQNGEFAYQALEHIIAVFFDDRFPFPLVQWALTAHGKCLGQTNAYDASPPVITMHPSVLHPSPRAQSGRKYNSPWGINEALLGSLFAYEVLLHECIHVSVFYVLIPEYAEKHGKVPKLETSHNNIFWLSEVKRIAPLLGLSDNVSLSKPRRVPVPGETTKTGKPKTRVVRMTEPGTLSFESVATFPYGMRRELKQLAFYRDKRLPWQVSRYPVTDNYVLQIPQNEKSLSAGGLASPREADLRYIVPDASNQTKVS